MFSFNNLKLLAQANVPNKTNEVSLSSFLGFFVFTCTLKIAASLLSFVWFLMLAGFLNIVSIKNTVCAILSVMAGIFYRAAQAFRFSGDRYFFPVSGVNSDISEFSYFSSYSFLPNFGLISYFVVVSTVIALLLLILPFILKPGTPGFEKNSSYECGFEPFVCKNEVFESHFLVVGVLFLLFDLELIFLFPLGAVGPTTNWLVSFAVLPFLGLLLIGFIFEWVRGALLWPIFYARRNSVF